MMDTTGLMVQGLSKRYAGVQALQDVGFLLEVGTLTALIGPNGAGKSTCFGVLAGQIKADAGRALWQGLDLLSLSPQQRLKAGMARSFQVAQVFEALTVQQNLWVLGDPKQAEDLLVQVGLHHVATQNAGSLAYGAKKRLELAMALAGEPQLLLLDEPAAGLNEEERHQLMALVQGLCKRNITVLYTEHNMDAVFGVADRVMVLVEGRMLADGSPQSVMTNPQVRERYLGQYFKEAARA